MLVKLADLRRDESGSSLVAVLIVMLVLTVAGLALGSIVVNTAGMVTDSRSRAESGRPQMPGSPPSRRR